MNITLEAHIGAGALGELHRGRDGDGGAIIAELLTHPDQASDVAARLGRVSDAVLPGMLRATRLVDLSGGIAILYEDFSGHPLSLLLDSSLQDAPSSRAIVGLFSQVAGALHAAWAQPVGGEGPLSLVHGGLDLRRIWVDDASTVKVEGLGAVDGSPAEGPCSPPEQSASHAGDVFSMGWLLAWALLGEQPSLQRSDDTLASEVSILAVRVREHTGDERLAALLEDMLRFSPSARPPAAMVISALQSIAAKMPGDALSSWIIRSPEPEPTPEPEAMPEPTPEPTPEPVAPERPRRRKSRLFSRMPGQDSFLDDDPAIPLTAPVRPEPRPPTPEAPPAPEPTAKPAEPQVALPPPEPILQAPIRASSRLFGGVALSLDGLLPLKTPQTPPEAEGIAPLADPSEEPPPVAAPPPVEEPLPIEEPLPVEEPLPAEEPAAVADPRVTPEPPTIPKPPDAEGGADEGSDEDVDDLDLDDRLPDKVEWTLEDAENIDSPEDWETSPVSSGVLTNPLAKPKTLINTPPGSDTDEAPRQALGAGSIIKPALDDEELDSRFFDRAAPTPRPAARPVREEEPTSSGRGWMVLLFVLPILLVLGWVLSRPDDPPTTPVDVPEAPPEAPVEVPEVPVEVPPELPVEEPPAPEPVAPVAVLDVTPTPPTPAVVEPEPEEPVLVPVRPTPTPVSPPPEPEVEEPAAAVSDNGKVAITGDAAAVTLHRDGRIFGSGSLPEGRYEIMATFTADGQPISSGTVYVHTGELAKVNCSAAFMRCQIR
ncbi:MAG: outer membrane biosynthesis protein TonB [Myxococcota bacterium]|jgi:outer membrane biosynthesis protein TonB